MNNKFVSWLDAKISMNKTFIIGASGLIGSSLFSLLKSKNINVFGTYANNSENGLIFFDLNRSDFSCFNEASKGDVCFITSAYSDPSWVTQNKLKAEELNYTKTIELINFFVKKEVRIIFMSSAEVFDGYKGSYSEEDLPNPLNFYGELKYRVENYLHHNCYNFTIVRTGWNIGLNEKSRCPVQLTYETLLNKNARMATDNFFSLCSVKDTATVLYKISEENKLNKIHICSDRIVNRKEMAELVIAVSSNGKKMSFSDCLFEDLPYSEPRGKINDLDNSLSKSLFDMHYFDANQLIINKVRYLDKKFT